MNARYKDLFQSILFILLIVLVLLILSITTSSCRSTKESTRVETATSEAVTVTTQDVTSVDQQHIDHNFTLSLDSLELWLPIGQENLAYLLPDTATTLGQRAVAQSNSNGQVPVLLKARRATLTSGTVAERTVVQTAQLQDSTSSSQDTASQIQESSDVVAVAHPVPPWVYIVPAVILALVILYFIHRKVKQ